MHALLARALDPHPETRAIDLDALAGWTGPVNLPVRPGPTVSPDDPTATAD